MGLAAFNLYRRRQARLVELLEMTVSELKKIAGKHGIEIPRNATKQQLIDLVKETENV